MGMAVRKFTLLLTVIAVLGITAGLNPEQNLKNYVKLTASLDPNVSTISYINGTVYFVQPGVAAKKIFYFEGFNIARKLPTSEGSYKSLSCELVVYRDLYSGHIVKTWFNPISSLSNEVIVVQNYPVNGMLSKSGVPKAVNLMPDTIVYNSDIPLRYPNPLPPTQYPLYSNGPYYVGAELFQSFGKLTELEDPTKNSVNVTTTWSRIAQWLPWMEMGSSKGNLFYSAFSWKIADFRDLPRDIFYLLLRYFPKFLRPPTDFDTPNETSWTVFKKIIDQRRKAGLPDIVFTPDDVRTNVTRRGPFLNPQLQSVLLRNPEFRASWSGSVYSITNDRNSIKLFNIKGKVSGKVMAVGGNFIVDVQVYGDYYDSKSGKILGAWLNPLTNETLQVPSIQSSLELSLTRDNVESVLIQPSKEIGLSAFNYFVDGRDWFIDSCLVVFSQQVLTGSPIEYYGTYSKQSGWLRWMKMNDRQGSMLYRINIASIP